MPAGYPRIMRLEPIHEVAAEPSADSAPAEPTRTATRLSVAGSRSPSFRANWLRIVIGVASLSLMARFVPNMESYQWVFGVYLAGALLAHLLIYKDIGGSFRMIGFGIMDLTLLAFVLQRFGTLAPMLVMLYFLAGVLYAFTMGLRLALALAVYASATYVGVLWAEVTGILPYAVDAPGWAASVYVPNVDTVIVISFFFPITLVAAVVVVGRLVESLKSEKRMRLELLDKYVVGRYRLERLIGHGGMGQVWEASHTVTGHRFALKFLINPTANTPEGRRRFLREAKAASAVHHPNVVQIYDVFELEDQTPVMVMDLLEGETLRERLDREGALPLGETAAILLRIVSAVGTAHARGVVHRDLKPSNIFLTTTPDGGADVKVLDFGIAKISQPHDDEATGGDTRGWIGTPWYMSPEHAFGETVDHRTDIWALGVILYECLSGKKPIDADNVGGILKELMAPNIAPLETVAPDVPPELAAEASKMLSRHRKNRPPDLRSLRLLLQEHADVHVPEFDPPARDRPSVDRDAATVPSSPKPLEA